MKIENLQSERNGSRAKVSATVTWEDCNRSSQVLYFETDQDFARDLSCNPHAFLVACIIPAMRYGEKRVSIDAEICPELRDGLMVAMGWFRHWYDWYGTNRNLVKIEAKNQQDVRRLSKRRKAGFFFSGGIDSLSTLRANRLHYPLEHPHSLRDGLLVYGLEVNEPKRFEYVVSSMSVLAHDAGITLIPVYTNITSLSPDIKGDFWDNFWVKEFMGAVFAAIAHAFSERLEVISINSNHDIPHQIPHGSHPLIDPNYSSCELQIKHVGINLSRFAKTKLVADWDTALQNLRVCNRYESYQPGVLNCGQCEKCVRTMLALLALGALEKTRAFPIHNVTKELIMETVHLGPTTFPLYGELLGPLKEKGRLDLVHAVEKKMSMYLQPQWRKNLKIRKKRIYKVVREFDKRYFMGILSDLKKKVCL